MKFERVRLENFKCYADADLRLERGVTVIHGVNGSGKSSLLEACFFALYGARALDRTLDELVTIGAEEATVELWFAHGGTSYHIKRRVRVRDDRASTAECVLEEPDGVVEGARDVRNRVASLLRMDHAAFVNCAYVRQGEVNKLINATPSERQDMIDDLLQLGRLEEYRARASDARVGVGRVLEGKRESLTQLDEQIEAKEDKDLHDQLNAAESELATVREELDRYEDQRETARETLEDATSILEEYEQRRAELDEVESEIEELTETIETTEREREDLADEIAERRERREEIIDRIETALETTELPTDADRDAVASLIDDLAERDDEIRDEIEQYRLDAQGYREDSESHREDASEAEERAAEKRTRADDLQSDLDETRADLTDRRETLTELDATVETIEATFADAPIDIDEAAAYQDEISDELTTVTEELTTLDARIESVEADIAEAEELLEAGKCPECGQSVEQAPRVDSLEEDRQRLAELRDERTETEATREAIEKRLERAETLAEKADEHDRLLEKRETLAELIAEREETIAETEDRIDTLRGEADELETEAEEHCKAAADAAENAEECREEIAACNERRGDLADRIETLEDVLADFDRGEDLDDAIETRQERRAQLEEMNDERRDRLGTLRERRSELSEAIDEERLAEAREDKDRAETYLEEVAAEIESREERRDELQARIGAIENEIEELESLRERRTELAETVERLESLYDEAEQLQEMYGQLRAELRQRNVETLERMLNDTFDLVYRNDSYDRIELDEEYHLTIYQKDGEALDPDQLSGGERALFNLSLRAAIYRLLAEGIEGAAPTPPLILDEPTVFLDSGHVSQLLELIEYMRAEIGVEQIVVVSHDDELVDAADDLVHVSKDATTNRSRVERRDSTVLPAD